MSTDQESTNYDDIKIPKREFCIWVISKIDPPIEESIKTNLDEEKTKKYVTNTRIQNTIYWVLKWIEEKTGKRKEEDGNGPLLKSIYEFSDVLELGGKHDEDLRRDIEVWMITGLLNQSRIGRRNHIDPSKHLGEDSLKPFEKILTSTIQKISDNKWNLDDLFRATIEKINHTSEVDLVNSNLFVEKTPTKNCYLYTKDSKKEKIVFWGLIPSLTKLPLDDVIKSIFKEYECQITHTNSKEIECKPIPGIENRMVDFKFKPEYIINWKNAHGSKNFLKEISEQLEKYNHCVTIYDFGLIKIESTIHLFNEIEISYHYREFCKYVLKVLRDITIVSDYADPQKIPESGIMYYKSGFNVTKDASEIFQEIQNEYLNRLRNEMHSIFIMGLTNMWVEAKKSGWHNLFAALPRKSPVSKLFEENIYAQTRINRTIANFLLLKKTLERIQFQIDNPNTRLKMSAQSLGEVLNETSALFDFYKELGENFRAPTQILDASLALVGIAATLFATGISIGAVGGYELVRLAIESLYDKEITATDSVIPLGLTLVGATMSITSLLSLMRSGPIAKIKTVLRGIGRTLNIQLN